MKMSEATKSDALAQITIIKPYIEDMTGLKLSNKDLALVRKKIALRLHEKEKELLLLKLSMDAAKLGYSLVKDAK